MNNIDTLKNTITCGDNVEYLSALPEGSIDLTVTSPPYDTLRQYNGYSFDFENVAKELFRVTKDGGVVVWVVGDKTVKGSESGTSFKQALYFKEVGFNLHDTMIYYKKTAPLTHKRYEQEFEYMFVFVKGKISTFNPIMIPKEYPDKRPNKIYRRNSDNTFDRGFSSQTTEKIKGNVWKYTVSGGRSTKDKVAYKHPAIFPDLLAEDHILSWSNEGDIVLDPFMGSGTTAKMAFLNKRNFIGCEISQEYCDIAEERLKEYMLNNVK